MSRAPARVVMSVLLIAWAVSPRSTKAPPSLTIQPLNCTVNIPPESKRQNSGSDIGLTDSPVLTDKKVDFGGTGELEACMKDGYVRLGFDLAENEHITEARPAIGNAAKFRKTQPKQKQPPGKSAANNTKSGRVVKTRTTRQTSKIIEIQKEELVEESAQEELDEKFASQSLDADNPKPSGHDANIFGHMVFEEADIRNDLYSRPRGSSEKAARSSKEVAVHGEGLISSDRDTYTSCTIV
ncbi:hypothetical protein N0V86_002943 [Didymella sp. IMI 355093]|nr:hypothetical protein N0V86_002943 [Didymella sp. IMI 355093]